MKIAGLDIGTTGCKCTVFDEQGRYLDKAYRDYPVKRAVGAHEMDVSVMLDGVYAVIQQMAEKYTDIAGIGVTSFGETFVCTDEKGNPLHLSMLYTDPRGTKEYQELIEKLGEKEIARITGLRPHEMYSIAKIMWIKKNEPNIYASTRHIFQMEDFVVYHLTGKAQIDYSLASRSMAFDIEKLCWSQEILEAAGVEKTLLSEPVPTGTIAGCVTDLAQEKTGLKADTKVISISHDQVAAAIGSGAFDSDIAVDGAGTVECLEPIFNGMPNLEAMYRGYFSIVPYVVPGKYVTYAFSYTGGALLEWCINALAKKEKDLAKEKGMSINDYLEQEYISAHGDADTLSGLLVLPHFSGAATPYMDTGSKGAILGLMTATTTADIYRGCMEAVVYEMYLNMEAVLASGANFKKIHATGGGAHSALWMQMKADVLNVPMVALKTVDAGTVGSAMLTGIALGLFQDLRDAAVHMVEETVTYEPRAYMHEKYMEVYEKYKQLYHAIRPLV